MLNIGITARSLTRHGEDFVSISRPLVDMLNGVKITSLFYGQHASADNLSGLILSGGESIGEDPRRDEYELDLLSSAIHAQVPVLGICRGMQVLCFHAGAKLEACPGHVRRETQLSCTPPLTVTCYHQWGLRSQPDGYRALAFSDDGLIESMESLDGSIVGVMWHPEREGPQSQSQRILTEFLAKCSA